MHEQAVKHGFSFEAGETVTLRGFAKPVTVFRVLGRDTE
jgi:class 3 adenylate cyclase